MKIPEALRGKDALDPEVLLWQSDRLLEQAYEALDRCFRKLRYDEEDVLELLPTTRFNDLLVALQEWREGQEDADDED